MNAYTLTLFKALKKHFSEEAAEDIVPIIEQMVKNNSAEQEERTVKSVENKIDMVVERKIEKEHKYLATKGDIIVVEEKIVKVEEKIMTLREEIVKQYRSFLTVNIAILAIVISILIYLITKVS